MQSKKVGSLLFLLQYRQALRLNPVHQPSYRGLSVLMAENKRGQEAVALVQGWILGSSAAAPQIIGTKKEHRELRG